MRCAWQAYLNLLPHGLRADVDKHGKDGLLELRMRSGMPIQLIMRSGSVWLNHIATKDDLSFCVNAGSRYSPWSVSSTQKGYITAPGGHRIGLCGTAVVQDGAMTSLSTVTSLCIRVARDFPGCAESAKTIDKSILIIGKPGSGKTTLLRDLIRYRSEDKTVAVVDEKGEIFPFSQETMCFSVGRQTDVLSGVSKCEGVEILLRNMNPHTIAVDEITAQEDCKTLLRAGWCGVDLFATVHASSLQELKRSIIYRPIIESGLFETFLVMQPDKSWRMERMKL